MFETAFGIPAHPLLIHAAVVLVPMLIAGAIVFGFVPTWRGRLDWAVAGLGVAAPIAAFLSRQSGLAFRSRLIREKAVSDQDLSKINTHMSYGTNTLYLSIALGVIALALVGYHISRTRAAGTGRPAGHTLASLVLAVLALLVGGVTAYYVFKTGDTGAHIVWQGR